MNRDSINESTYTVGDKVDGPTINPVVTLLVGSWQRDQKLLCLGNVKSRLLMRTFVNCKGCRRLTKVFLSACFSSDRLPVDIVQLKKKVMKLKIGLPTLVPLSRQSEDPPEKPTQ
ncbi:hypothetical protein L1987_45958 [Smallanthus sonchifolius]|uniref:Uncharacterized protein n=1 Tax=Smallanthus sonchifolius TaxID=185202 RepID=A0ACB9G050_9ASTR|nr:hypothetical protein L1987_45958 [Smallanthus sonchifolius]